MSAATEAAAGLGRTPLDLPLDRGGTTFIEASAGTGKTRALTTLVARLVIEEGRQLDEILVVTFTRAATAELRDRIRRVLRAVLGAVRARDPAGDRGSPTSEPGAQAPGAGAQAPRAGTQAPEPEAENRASAVLAAEAEGSTESAFPAGSGRNEVNPQARELLEAWERKGGEIDRALARRLEAAMRDIDRANVHTIHGFCQRVLADLAFESGFPFGFEVSGGDVEIVAGAVRDFWRRRLYPASMLVTRYAVESGFLPAELTTWVSARRAKTGVTMVGGDPLAEPIEAREAAWREVFEAVRAEWDEGRNGFRAEMLEGPWLNRSRYKRPRTARELAAIEALLAAPDPWLPEEGELGRYGRETLSRACKKNFTLPNNALFDVFDRLEEASQALRSACDQWLRWVRREVLTEVRASIRRHVRDDRRLAYDDLLIELHDALGDVGGKRLAERIRHAYPCALIDEYQDTDPIQTRIFSRIYGEDRTGPTDAAEARQADPVHAAGARRAEPVDTAGPMADRSSISAGRPGTNGSGQDGSSRMDVSDPGERIERGGASSSVRGERTRPGPFIVVGDPKQSIYRFRGADVFAYLAARRGAHERLHLDRNWRSVPALVEAVNAVFAGAAPFVTPEIEYRPVNAAKDPGNPLRLPSGESSKFSGTGEFREFGPSGGPLELWLLPRPEGGKPLTKKDVNPVVTDTTANEIARLLGLGACGEATIEGKPLTGADIAVLVRTRAQGRLIAGALRDRAVRSIEIDDGSVFHTREAEQLERLLWALAEPGRESGVRGALAGDLFGLDARALLALGDDEGVWSDWVGRLADWRRHRESRGIGSILLRLLEGEEGAKHLLGHHDGTRRLTNYRHLAELLQETETRERLAPSELATWLNRRRAESDRGDDAVQLRLESDEQLVKILTVHGAKGLEFPVVFCPFAWDARGPRRQSGAVDAMYHLGEAEDYREVLDLNPNDRAAAVEWIEEFSESVRLLYVALTRAEYRCVVAWGQVRGAEQAPLAWLLHRAARPPAAMTEPGHGELEGDSGAQGPGAAVAAAESESGPAQPDAAVAALESGSSADDPDIAIAALRAVAGRFLALSALEWRREIDAFARRLPDAVSVIELDPEPPRPRAPVLSADPRPVLAAHELARPLRRIRSLTSFSALCAETFAAAGDLSRTRADSDDAEIDRPDHDQRVEPVDAAGDETAPPGGGVGRERSVFTFPRGPVAGSCLHRIFERLDTPPEPGSEQLDVEAICRQALEDFGIAGDWQPIARAMVDRTYAVHLHEPERAGPSGDGGPGGHAGSPGTAGADRPGGFRLADPLPRLVELEFHFPVDGLDRHRLAAVLVEHGYPDPFAGPGRSGASASPLPIHGFLRGFIDLVVEHAGRWYIVDYKSNWLGPKPGDYAPDALTEAMRAGGYALQSVIYLVALHRYLAVRMPGYEYERDVGGAFYLFVRGIDPAAGMGRGVYFDRPSAACLHALDDCFRGGGT